MFYLLSCNTYTSYLSAHPGPRGGPRIYERIRVHTHVCQVRKRCFARGASLAFQYAQDDSMPSVRAYVHACVQRKECTLCVRKRRINI